jgi:large subunit ribosomal protein L21e
MVMRIGGARRKTRQKYRKTHRTKGKMSVSKFYAEFKIGEKVALKLESSYPGGIVYRRFYGKNGEICGMAGSCVKVIIKDQGKFKTLIVHPIHLKRF